MRRAFTVYSASLGVAYYQCFSPVFFRYPLGFLLLCQYLWLRYHSFHRAPYLFTLVSAIRTVSAYALSRFKYFLSTLARIISAFLVAARTCEAYLQKGGSHACKRHRLAFLSHQNRGDVRRDHIQKC